MNLALMLALLVSNEDSTEHTTGRVSFISLQGKELGDGEFAKMHQSNISLSQEKMLYPIITYEDTIRQTKNME